MKLRTGLIISLFVCLLVIGSVSAADNGTDDKVTLEDTSISETSTDSISEQKQEIKEVTTDEIKDISDKQVDNVNFKSTNKEVKNGKLESSVINEDNLKEVDPLSVSVYDNNLYGEESTLISVNSPSGDNGETGDLNIYVNNVIKKTYVITNGTINDGTSYGKHSLSITLKNLGITEDGTYQINVTIKRINQIKELQIIQKKITYKYTPFTARIGSDYYGGEDYYDYYDEGSYSKPIISISQQASANGYLNIYVDNVLKKQYNITNSGYYGSYYYYGSSYTINFRDIMKLGSHNVKVEFDSTDKEKIIMLAQKKVNYNIKVSVSSSTFNYYNEYYDDYDGDYYQDSSYYFSLSSDKVDIRGNLKILINNNEIRTYSVTDGKIEDGNYSSNYLYVSRKDLGIDKEGTYNIKVKVLYQYPDTDEIIVYDNNITYLNAKVNYNYNKEKAIFNLNVSKEITGNFVAYTTNRQYISSYYSEGYYVYEKKEKIGICQIMGGFAKLEVPYSKIEESSYAYEGGNVIILELTTNKGTINRTLGLYPHYGDETEDDGSSSGNENTDGQNSDQNSTNNGNNSQNPNPGNNDQGSATSQGPTTDTSTNTQSNTEKPSFTQTKTVKSVSKKAKQLTISTTLKLGTKKAKKGTKVTYKIGSKTFKVKTNNKGVAKLTIKKSDLKKILKKVKAGKKIKVQIKYGKTTVTKYIKVKK